MKVLSFGEILLRLTAPGYTRLFQDNALSTSFCGGEANVAVSLAIFGIDSQFITKLPGNEIGQAALNSMRYFGVDCSKAIRGEGRMGLYYLEKGASQRASKIIYDRAHSAISLSKSIDFDWDTIFKGVDWFHWTGITPALSDSLAQICMEACKKAKEKGVTVSCDLNYRHNLWTSEKAQSVMKQLMPYVDVCIANEEDAEKVLGIQANETGINFGKLNEEDYQRVASNICSNYGCKYVAFTLRESYSASHNGWSALLYDGIRKIPYYSKKYSIHIVDRVGSGDSFTAGIIYGLIKKKSVQEVIDFATAASCLKHTVEGDYNRVTVEEVLKLANGDGTGRVVR